MTFTNRDRANEKYMDNILPYMLQKIDIDLEFVRSMKQAISFKFGLMEKYLYTNEQLKNQIIFSISDSKFMTESQKDNLIQYIQSTFNNIGNDMAKEDSVRKDERKKSKKYPLIMLVISVCFTVIVYAICPEKVDDPNSIAQALVIFGIIFSFANAITLWMMILSESTNKISVGFIDDGIVGITNTVMTTLVKTIADFMYGKGKRKDTDNK